MLLSMIPLCNCKELELLKTVRACAEQHTANAQNRAMGMLFINRAAR